MTSTALLPPAGHQRLRNGAVADRRTAAVEPRGNSECQKGDTGPRDRSEADQMPSPFV
jgi:hypothetical protein